jgi:iron complex transport system ATP-binding protein
MGLTALIQVSDLRFGYGKRAVGESISLSLAGGEVLALLGSNGCGKTTLLKTMLGVLPAQGGVITLNGRPLREWSLAERARCVAYVPQGQASTFGFTAMEMVLMGRTAHLGLLARPSTRDRAIAQDALQRLDMAHLAERSVHQMSGGERQLVLIARALAQQPRAVLLDEPTASLDFGNQGLVLRAVRTLAMEGLAVLLTTHDPNQALRCADRALLMREGQVMAQGPVREVVTASALRELYRAEVLEVATSDDDLVIFLPGL